MLRSGNYIDYKSKLMREKYHYDIWNFENYNKSLGQIKVPYVLHLLYFIGSAIVSLIVGIVYSEYINLNLNIAIAEIILYLFNGSAVIFCVLYCVNILNGTKEYNMPTITELNTRQSKYAICIPVVNEGIRLKKQLLEMKRLHIYEQADIIICDGNSVDGSTDPDFLREAKVFALIQCPRAHQSEQLIEGFKFALEYAYEGVITIDGNNKDSVSTIPLFISKIQEGYGFVQGSRYIKGGVAANTPLIRTFAIKFHVHFMNKITNGNFTDTTNGFRAFHSMVLLGHYSQLFNERTYSSHEIAYYLFVIAAKYKHTEVAVSRKYPIKGRATKIVPIIGHLELLWILIKLRMHKDSNQVQELP